MPFKMGAKVIDIAKELANDPTVLKGMSLERTACQYKLKDRLAVVCHQRIVSDLKKHRFLLTMMNVWQQTTNVY